MTKSGFSLVEVMVASLLSTLLLLMASSVWMPLGRAMTDNVADTELAGEARLVLESLRRDFSGYLPGRTIGEKQLGRLVGRMVIGGNRLRLCYDGGTANGEADWWAPDDVVEYYTIGRQLCRADAGQGVVAVMSDGVTQFNLTEEGDGVRIEFAIQRRGHQQTYTIITQNR